MIQSYLDSFAKYLDPLKNIGNDFACGLLVEKISLPCTQKIASCLIQDTPAGYPLYCPFQKQKDAQGLEKKYVKSLLCTAHELLI